MLSLFTVRSGGPTVGASIAVMVNAMSQHDPSIASPTLDDLPAPAALHWVPHLEGTLMLIEKSGTQVTIDTKSLDNKNIVWLRPETVAIVHLDSGAWTLRVNSNGSVDLDSGVVFEATPSLPPGAGPKEFAALRWLKEGEVGSSSKTLCHHLTGLPVGMEKSDYSHPFDPADFLRCMKLLDAIPELRADLSKMSSVSPAWAALVQSWGSLESSIRAELAAGTRAQDTYAAMHEILERTESSRSPAAFR